MQCLADNGGTLRYTKKENQSNNTRLYRKLSRTGYVTYSTASDTSYQFNRYKKYQKKLGKREKKLYEEKKLNENITSSFN